MVRQDQSPKEPPSPDGSLYMIGRDRGGRWVVQDQSGLHGGLFINRAEALKFALFENGHRPQAVVMVPGVLELNCSEAAFDLESLCEGEHLDGREHERTIGIRS